MKAQAIKDADMAPWNKDFKVVSKSLYIGDADDIAEVDTYEIVKCACISKNGEPTCNTNHCCNYAMQVECVHCGPHCSNKKIQNNVVAQIEVKGAQGKGYGLFAGEALPEGSYIREYVGEIVTLAELIRRRENMGQAEHLYAMEIKRETYIDSTRVGSISRFINHSCEPNCTAEVWVVKNRLRVAITAMKDISLGEELSFDYCWEPLKGRELTKCLCGAPSCRGTIEICTSFDQEGSECRFVAKTGQWRSSEEALLEALRSETQKTENGGASGQDMAGLTSNFVAVCPSPVPSGSNDHRTDLNSGNGSSHSSNNSSGSDNNSAVNGSNGCSGVPPRGGSHLTAHLTANLNGEWLVGRRVKVLWEGNQTFFEGDVTGYNGISNKHSVHYGIDDSTSDELLWSRQPENPWSWLDESRSDRGITKRKVPRLTTGHALTRLVASGHSLRPPLPPGGTHEVSSYQTSYSTYTEHAAFKVKRAYTVSDIAASYLIQIIPVLNQRDNGDPLLASDIERLKVFMDVIEQCSKGPYIPQVPISQGFSPVPVSSPYSTPTTGSSYMVSPSRSFSPHSNSGSTVSEVCRALQQTLKSVSIDVSIKTSEVVKPSSINSTVPSSLKQLWCVGEGSADGSVWDAFSRGCVAISVYATEEKAEALERLLVSAMVSYRAAMRLWGVQHRELLRARQPLSLSRDWRVLFAAGEAKGHSNTGGGSDADSTERGEGSPPWGYPSTKDLIGDLLPTELLFDVPLQLTEKTEENKESVSSSNLTSFNTTSHPNVKSQIVEAVYTKCIAQLRNICTRMKLPITVTIHAVSLLHRALRICDGGHLTSNLIGVLSSCVSVSLKATGMYKLKHLRKICLISYCVVYGKEEKFEVSKFGFQSNKDSNGLVPLEDSVGFVYMNKLFAEETHLLKSLGMDVNLMDLSSLLFRSENVSLDYYSDERVLKVVYGVSLDSISSEARSHSQTTKALEEAQERNLLQTFHLFVLSNCALPSSTATPSKSNEVSSLPATSFSGVSSPYPSTRCRVDSFSSELIALGCYTLACAIWNTTELSKPASRTNGDDVKTRDPRRHSEVTTGSSSNSAALPVSDVYAVFDVFEKRNALGATYPPPVVTSLLSLFVAPMGAMRALLQVTSKELLLAVDAIQLHLSALYNKTDPTSGGTLSSVIGTTYFDWCDSTSLRSAYQLAKHWILTSISSADSPMILNPSLDIESSYRVRVSSHVKELKLKSVEVIAEGHCSIKPISKFVSASLRAKTPNPSFQNSTVSTNSRYTCSLGTLNSKCCYALCSCDRKLLSKEHNEAKQHFVLRARLGSEEERNEVLLPELSFLSRTFQKPDSDESEPLLQSGNCNCCTSLLIDSVEHIAVPRETLDEVSLSHPEFQDIVTPRAEVWREGQIAEVPSEKICVSDSLASLQDSLHLVSVRRWPNSRVQAAEALKRSAVDKSKCLDEVSCAAIQELHIIQRLHYLSLSGRAKGIVCPFGVMDIALLENSGETPKTKPQDSSTVIKSPMKVNVSKRLRDDPVTSLTPFSDGPSLLQPDTTAVTSLLSSLPNSTNSLEDTKPVPTSNKKRRRFAIPSRTSENYFNEGSEVKSIEATEIENTPILEGSFGETLKKEVEANKLTSFDVGFEVHELSGESTKEVNEEWSSRPGSSVMVPHFVFPSVYMSGKTFMKLATEKDLFSRSAALFRTLSEDLFEAVRYCSLCGVSFRYLTIDHVAIDRLGRLILSDLSGAVLSEPSSVVAPMTQTDTTVTYSVSLSQCPVPLHYMHACPPEVLFGAGPSETSSVYCAALLALHLTTGRSVFKPLVEHTRETSVTILPEGLASEIKRAGGDRFVHCQLQQIYRTMGTPKTMGCEDYRQYPMGGVYKGRYCASDGKEVECRCRLPKVIGAYPAALLQCYAPAQDTIPALPFEVPAEWARIGRLAVLVQGLQLCRHLRPLWPHFLSSPHSVFHPSLRLPLEISSSPHPYSAISERMDDGSGAGEQGSTVYVGGGAMDATQRVSALRRLREV